ncbi:PAS domain S-box-containing protein [Lacibacter cauensis]|uniref:histidine kinase n=1 Tax=Lacibacter cauensis TaxID=510947 RepID=A0A562SF88_9BACT|nr:PAS domain-containing sensor histidine kinase [Lacibacter cauensis]TWI79306.1 PAS domain S-box-containing protein [Lacibacter cauensis]
MQSIAEAKLFQTLFDHASIGIILVNAEATIVSVNQFGVAQFGYGSKDEILGKKIEILIPARFHHRHVHQREHYMHEPKSRPMGIGLDLFATKKDGTEFPVEVSLGNYEVENEFFVVAFVNDITARKKAEQALLQLNEELEEKVEARTISLQETVQILNEKIDEIEEKDKDLRAALNKERELGELKSRFVSVASHEFRTPLSTVLSSVYLLQKYTSSEDQPKREKHIQRIISSVNLLTDILNDFLNVGKIEEGKIQARFSVFDLEKNLSDTISEMRSMCKVGQQITYKHSGETQVELDPGMFKHISLNLLSNAIKFSPENSEISLATTVTPAAIELRIKDSGIGISKEDQEHLFERFFRAANAINIQGTGLGLHIVSKYAELMNGKITCHSEADKGTEFIITFQKRSAQ